MIPIIKPFLGKEETTAISKAIESGWVTQGPKVKEFEDEFAKYVGAKHACAVSNCTTALHLALLAVGVKPGNLVITVSHSFIATANSIRFCNAEPIFVDIDSSTYNMGVDALKELLKRECVLKAKGLFYKKTKKLITPVSPLSFVKDDKKEFGQVAAILVVHQMGMPCDLPSILRLAKKYKLPVVEDAACAIGSEISFNSGKTFEKIGKPHGDIACFSFHPRKIVTTGDGGMLTTSNQEYDVLFRLLRHHGMSVSDLERHKSKKVVFEHYPQLGFNYRLTDIQASIGIEQLKKISLIIEKRRKIAVKYNELLSQINWIGLTKEPNYTRTNWQSFSIRILKNAPLTRDKLMQYLMDQGISSRPGIMNAHEEKVYTKSKWKLPNSKKAREDVLLLPLFHQMTDEQVTTIVEAIKNAK